jgi:hypothetical protein
MTGRTETGLGYTWSGAWYHVVTSDPMRVTGRPLHMEHVSNRRALAKSAVASIAAVVAVDTTAASMQAAPTDAEVLALSERLVAIGPLDAAVVPELTALILAGDASGQDFRALEAMPEFSHDALAPMPEGVRTLSRNILEYWFLGRWAGTSLPGTPDRFFELACWAALPYPTHPTLCKGFGYWSQPVTME